MKASELRIGNICHQGVVSIIKEERFTVASSLGSDYDSLCINIEPEPITEEWLIKFGFVDEGKRETKNHGNFFSKAILDYKYCFAYADFRNDWGFYQEYTDSPFLNDEGKKYFISCGIRYVHQLQNLWFALTGEELTIKS
jgi:hypothetical protein